MPDVYLSIMPQMVFLRKKEKLLIIDEIHYGMLIYSILKSDTLFLVLDIPVLEVILNMLEIMKILMSLPDNLVWD